MNLQGAVGSFLFNGGIPGLGKRLMQECAWTIQDGEGAGLRMKAVYTPDYITGANELPVQQALKKYLKPGSVFYDVGANIGFFSLIAAKLVGPSGRVYAFEPVTKNANALRINAALNQFPQIDVFHLAVGDVSAEGELIMTAWPGGASLATTTVVPPDSAGRIATTIVALDDFVERANLRAPNVVKIDVEGTENEVLAGMAHLLREINPILIYEVDDSSVEGFERRCGEICEHVSLFGYRVQKLEAYYPGTHWHVGHFVALPTVS